MTYIDAKARTSDEGIAYSFLRFSTPQQALGDSSRRQIKRSRAYCTDNGLHLAEEIRDEGLSGYHGVHRKRGALGRFVERFESGEIPPGVLIVEGFDRFSREPPRIAQAEFLRLINAGMDIVTLIDGQRFSADSIDRNVGQLFLSIGMMLGAHQESKNKADRIAETWLGRRTNPMTNLYPGWIIRTPGGPEVDKDKQRIIKRIFREVLTEGVEKIAKRLNEEGKPTLNSRKRKRSVCLWDKTAIVKLVRGRQVLGEQPVGKYIDGKRQLTGEVLIGAYPAVVTEGEWYAANKALDARKRGTGTGRNVAAGFTNLFGDLARCDLCNGTMKVRGRSGRSHAWKYLGCSNAGVRGCGHRTYHRLDKYEATILKVVGGLIYEDASSVETGTSLGDQINQAKGEAEALESRYMQAAERFLNAVPGSLEDKLRQKLSSDHQEKLAQIAALEKKMLESQIPPTSTKSVQKLVERLGRLSGEELIAARRRIAQALPQVVREIRFEPDRATVRFQDGMRYGHWRHVTLSLAANGKVTVTYASEIEGMGPFHIRWHNAAPERIAGKVMPELLAKQEP